MGRILLKMRVRGYIWKEIVLGFYIFLITEWVFIEYLLSIMLFMLGMGDINMSEIDIVFF